MNDIMEKQNASVTEPAEITMKNRLEIIEEGIRKKYLARLNEMEIVPVSHQLSR